MGDDRRRAELHVRGGLEMSCHEKTAMRYIDIRCDNGIGICKGQQRLATMVERPVAIRRAIAF